MDIIAGILIALAYIIFAKGYVYYSQFLFLSANIFFLLFSLQNHSYFGAFTIIIGIVCQIYATWKMYKGIFHKFLHKE